MYSGNNEYSFKIGCELSAITHGHPTGYLSAGFFASVISDLAVGVKLDKAIENGLVILRKWDNCLETLRAVNSATELFQKVKTSGIIRAKKLKSLTGGLQRSIVNVTLCSLVRNDLKVFVFYQSFR